LNATRGPFRALPWHFRENENVKKLTAEQLEELEAISILLDDAAGRAHEVGRRIVSEFDVERLKGISTRIDRFISRDGVVR